MGLRKPAAKGGGSMSGNREQNRSVRTSAALLLYLGGPLRDLLTAEVDLSGGDDDPWELLTIQTHALEAEEDKNDALLAEKQRLADRAVCSGCGSDVDEGGICHYEGRDDGQMIPASDLPGALREACDAQSEQWKEHAEEIREMLAENQQLREKAQALVDADWNGDVLGIAWTEMREALAGDTG